MTIHYFLIFIVLKPYFVTVFLEKVNLYRLKKEEFPENPPSPS